MNSTEIPTAVQSGNLPGLIRSHSGKVRDTYSLDNVGYPGLRLVVTTDRISVFDVILPALVPEKGIVLNLIDLWWRKQLWNLPHDVVAWGNKIDSYLPEGLRNNHFLHLRSRISQTCQMIDAELIVRGYLTGTALTQYKESGEVCGQKLPKGLKEWDELPTPLFTPTTKSKGGHDEPMNIEEFKRRFGEASIDRAFKLYEYGRKQLAHYKLVLVDTKFEMSIGFNPVIADEILTPDSSRYISMDHLQRAQQDPAFRPSSLDKQPVRDWAKEALQFGPKSPLTDELVQRVHAAEVPGKVVEDTKARYRQFFRCATGMEPNEFLREA